MCQICNKIEDYDQIKNCLTNSSRIRPEIIEKIENEEKWELENLEMKKEEILNCLNLGSTSQKLKYLCLCFIKRWK